MPTTTQTVDAVRDRVGRLSAVVATDTGTVQHVETPAPQVRRMGKGGWVTLGTVVTLTAAMGLTVLGLGVADHAVASFDASAWLWSAAKSEIARVNGVTGRVDTRVEVAAATNHPMEVSQTDRFLVLRDLATGQVSSLDLTTLQVAATTRTTAGLGVSVAVHDGAAFVVDAVQGMVRQIDPHTLVPVGEAVRFPPGITGGTFDGAGRLWVAVPSEGTVAAITAAPLPAPGGVAAGAAGPTPQRVRTVTVAGPSHDLVMSTLDDGVAVLDRTTSTLTTVRGDRQRAVPLRLRGPGSLPPHTDGARVPVTAPDDRQIVVVGDGAPVADFTVSGAGRVRPAIAWAGWVYCADEQTGTVRAFDASGRLVDTIQVKGAGGLLELEVREDHLFVNAPNASTARVIDDNHRVRVVDKYADDVLGGDPPPAPPPPRPKKPTVSTPSAPRSVTAAAGDAQVKVSWLPAVANGAAIVRYVVEGAAKPIQVGAAQRSVEITGLTNGQTYRFTVHAVNGKGAGPGRRSNPVVPTAEVPDPPASVKAQERPDGTVLVTWPAADGQGNKIAKYAVTAASAGASAPAGESTKTALVIKAGDLEFGKQYAFTVVSVNDKGAASKASPVSNTVVPFTAPAAPGNTRAVTVDAKGSVQVSWDAAADNGRPVTGYVVAAGGRSWDVTALTARLDGFGDGVTVQVTVRAVNEAGQGQPSAATARTISPPQLTAGARGAAPASVTVDSTVNDGQSATQCQLTVSQGGRSAASGWGDCRSRTVGVWRAGTSYAFTLAARNAAGTDQYSGTVSSSSVSGTVTCNDGGGTYCDSGIGIYANSRQQSSEAKGAAANGTRFEAWCKKAGTQGNQGGPTLYAAGYNSNKRSSWWVQITYKGTSYIPFIWINLDNGDNVDALPTCS
jgi:hypothetical protein